MPNEQVHQQCKALAAMPVNAATIMQWISLASSALEAIEAFLQDHPLPKQAQAPASAQAPNEPVHQQCKQLAALPLNAVTIVQWISMVASALQAIEAFVQKNPISPAPAQGQAPPK